MRVGRALRLWAAAALLMPLAGTPAHAQTLGGGLSPSEVELEDVIAIEMFERDLFAYDLLGTGRSSIRLEIGEALLWSDARGRVGLALTDRRMLAASPGSESWQEVRYQVHETAATSAFLGKRVGMVVTEKRALGFDGSNGRWIEIPFGPQERVNDARVGDATAVVLTNRSAYGLSPDAGGFFQVKLSVQERVEGLRVRSNSATVSTSKRLLVFRAPAGSWTEERRPIN